MPVWHETINIRQYMRREEPLVLNSDGARAEFERIKNGVCDELRKTRHFRDSENLNRLRELRCTSDDRSDEFGEALLVASLIESLQKAGSIAEFDEEMRYVYMWADDRRVWLAG